MSIPSATVLLARLMARARFRHLQLFVKVAALSNLKRAAEALSISQPAATQLLADLERLVDVKLFDRHARGVRITTAGEALLPAAQRALQAMADASEVVAVVKQQGEGVVRLAAITGAMSGWLVHVLPAFAQEAPTLQIHVLECEVDQCARLVSQRQVDVALCREPVAMPSGCTFHPRLPDDFVVACGLQHPLARRKRVNWETLGRERWLLPPVQSAARHAFDQRMQALGASPATSPVVTRVPAITWAMLQGDRLLTLVPYGVVRQLVEARQLAIVDTNPALPFAPVGCLLPDTGVGEATRRLLDHLEAFAHRPA